MLSLFSCLDHFILRLFHSSYPKDGALPSLGMGVGGALYLQGFLGSATALSDTVALPPTKPAILMPLACLTVVNFPSDSAASSRFLSLCMHTFLV